MYGDGHKLDLLWLFYNIYKYWNIILYTWN